MISAVSPGQKSPVSPHINNMRKLAAPSAIEIPTAGMKDLMQMNNEENIPVPLV